MDIRKCAAALAVVLLSCAPTQVKRLTLTILQPQVGDTIHSPAIPIEGLTTPGASVSVAPSTNDPGVVFAVDDTGHFAGTLPFEDMDSTYHSAVFTVKLDTRSITDSRTVYYLRP